MVVDASSLICELVSMKYLSKSEVVETLAAACEIAGGQKAWADENGLSAPYVSDVINSRRDPGDAICRALRLEKRIVYVRKPNAK